MRENFSTGGPAGLPEEIELNQGFIRVVPGAGIEPARLAAGDFESGNPVLFWTSVDNRNADNLLINKESLSITVCYSFTPSCVKLCTGLCTN